jgi:hypothetical protein
MQRDPALLHSRQQVARSISWHHQPSEGARARTPSEEFGEFTSDYSSNTRAGFWGRFAPLAGWPLPDRSPTLRRLREAPLNKHAGREYVQVPRLPGKGGEKNFYPITVSN